MSEKEWFPDFSGLPRLTLLPWLLWALVIGIVIAAVFHASRANARALYKAQGGDVEIVLHSEDCALGLRNLRRRATWTEGGVVTEGCYAQHPEYPIVLMYFADKSVVVLLTQVFQSVDGV